CSPRLPAPHPTTLFPYTTLFRSPEPEPEPAPAPVPTLPDHPLYDNWDNLSSTDKRRRGRSLKKRGLPVPGVDFEWPPPPAESERSEEHTSELQSRFDLVCRLLLE